VRLTSIGNRLLCHHNMNDKERMEALLNLVGKDDELLETIATAIGDNPKDFGDFVDFVEFTTSRGNANHTRRAGPPLKS
jgi:hypothetical protein